MKEVLESTVMVKMANITNQQTQIKVSSLHPNDRISVLPEIPSAPVSVKISHVILPASNNLHTEAIRRIQGYGNCFFRSVAFSILENLTENHDQHVTQRFRDLLMLAVKHIRPYYRTKYKMVVDKVFGLLSNTEVLVMEFSCEQNSIDAVLCDLIRIIVWEHVCRVTKNRHDPQARSTRKDIENDEETPLRYYQEHLIKIITNRKQVNSGVVRPTFKALKTSGDVLVQSPQGCLLQSFNSEAVSTDLITKILLLNKDLHYEVLYAAPAANPTIITGPSTPAQTAAAVSAHRLPFQAILTDQGNAGQPDSRVPHLSTSTEASVRNNVSGKSGENDEFSGKRD